jgi:hypothetical protein
MRSDASLAQAGAVATPEKNFGHLASLVCLRVR